MTIYLFTGTPGSGKSLHVAELIYWSVKLKRPVIANFEINDTVFKDASSFTYADDDVLSPEFLERYAMDYWNGKRIKEGAIKLYIDECSLMFNARDWSRSDRKAWVRFFQLHRKLGYDIYLITQFDTMIDKQVRALVEYEVKHRKVNNVGWVGRTFGLLAFGRPIICAVTYWYAQKMRLSSEFMLGKKRYYRLYDSYRLFQDVKGASPSRSSAESAKKITEIRKSA